MRIIIDFLVFIAVVILIAFIFHLMHLVYTPQEDDTRTCVDYTEVTICSTDHEKYRLTPSRYEQQKPEV